MRSKQSVVGGKTAPHRDKVSRIDQETIQEASNRSATQPACVGLLVLGPGSETDGSRVHAVVAGAPGVYRPKTFKPKPKAAQEGGALAGSPNRGKQWGAGTRRHRKVVVKSL